MFLNIFLLGDGIRIFVLFHLFNVQYQIYEFRNNEYRPFAMNVKRIMCDFIKKEYGLFMFSELGKYPGSIPIPVECPVKPVNILIIRNKNFYNVITFKKYISS